MGTAEAWELQHIPFRATAVNINVAAGTNGRERPRQGKHDMCLGPQMGACHCFGTRKEAWASARRLVTAFHDQDDLVPQR